MATELLPIASGAADSADFTVTSTGVTVGIKYAFAGVAPKVKLYIKADAGGTYHEIDELNGQRGALVIVGPGVYRASRVANGASVGAWRDP